MKNKADVKKVSKFLEDVTNAVTAEQPKLPTSSAAIHPVPIESPGLPTRTSSGGTRLKYSL